MEYFLKQAFGDLLWAWASIGKKIGRQDKYCQSDQRTLEARMDNVTIN